MGKKYFILNTDKKGSGVAKLDIANGRPYITFDIKNYLPLSGNEIFKGYILNGNRFSLVGSMETCKESFYIDKDALVEGVVVIRKNLENDKGEVEFWGGSSNQIKVLAENSFNATETIRNMQASDITENSIIEDIPIRLEDEEASALETSVENKTQQEEVEKKMPTVFTFESFFGGGFDWQRVNGYFSLYHYSIMQHIMSGRSVYETINYFGYYYSGIKEGDGITYIATAIPARNGFESPFHDYKENVYTIEDDRHIYHVICVGIDKVGEFFVEL